MCSRRRQPADHRLSSSAAAPTASYICSSTATTDKCDPRAMRRLLSVALVGALLALVPASPAHAEHRRIAGNDRYATSAAVSASAVLAGRDIVYVASGADFPDALVAAPVAGTQRTSVL